MHITKWLRKENSGLFYTTLEHAKYEERAGHTITCREPHTGNILYGPDSPPDVHTIHSQVGIQAYHDGAPKLMLMHGEPLSSVANGVSLKAILDLAQHVDAFICLRQEEAEVWRTIKRTYVVPKGIDLELFAPATDPVEKLEGNPAVLYYENWRGQRNPLYPLIAMKLVWQQLPEARLHLYNCTDKKMHETFSALIKQCKLWPYVRSLMGQVTHAEVPALLNRADIVVSGLYPLYARGIEALGCGKAFIGAGYKEAGYPWQTEMSPEAMAATIIDCWGDYDKVNYRQWALDHHDEAESAKQRCAIYQRYL